MGKKANANNNTFVSISNEDFFARFDKFENKIEGKFEQLNNKMDKMDGLNTEQHTILIERYADTKGKIGLNRWIASTALVLAITALGMNTGGFIF